MRFLRGLGVGILCFIIVMFVSFVMVGNITEWDVDEEGNLVTIGEVTFDRAMEEVPEWTIITLLAFFGMFIGPLYYWVIEHCEKKEALQQEPIIQPLNNNIIPLLVNLVGMKSQRSVPSVTIKILSNRSSVPTVTKTWFYRKRVEIRLQKI
ncbi:MAG: hypothetical protein ACFFDT_10820 [Candidatus Hodarchaeota archaeon]